MLCNHYWYTVLKNHHKGDPKPISSQSSLPPPLCSRQALICFLYLLIYLFRIFHIVESYNLRPLVSCLLCLFSPSTVFEAQQHYNMNSFSWFNSIPLYGYTAFVCLFICWWIFGHFHLLAAANSAAGNMRVPVSTEYLFSVFFDRYLGVELLSLESHHTQGLGKQGKLRQSWIVTRPLKRTPAMWP